MQICANKMHNLSGMCSASFRKRRSRFRRRGCSPRRSPVKPAVHPQSRIGAVQRLTMRSTLPLRPASRGAHVNSSIQGAHRIDAAPADAQFSRRQIGHRAQIERFALILERDHDGARLNLQVEFNLRPGPILMGMADDVRDCFSGDDHQRRAWSPDPNDRIGRRRPRSCARSTTCAIRSESSGKNLGPPPAPLHWNRDATSLSPPFHWQSKQPILSLPADVSQHKRRSPDGDFLADHEFCSIVREIRPTQHLCWKCLACNELGLCGFRVSHRTWRRRNRSYT